MSCPNCRTQKVMVKAFDRFVYSVQRRYDRALRAWERDPNTENTVRVNAIRLIANAANKAWNDAATGRAETGGADQ